MSLCNLCGFKQYGRHITNLRRHLMAKDQHIVKAVHEAGRAPNT